MIWKMPRTSKTCPSLTRDFRRPARKPIRSAWCAQRATCREWIRKRGIPVRKSRRQIVNRIVEAAGMGLVALDIVVFIAAYRPLGIRLEAEERHHSELRQTVRNQKVRVDLLKKYEAALPQAGKGLGDFMTNRIPPRREAFSTAAHLIHKAADAAGVKLSGSAYRLN